MKKYIVRGAAALGTALVLLTPAADARNLRQNQLTPGRGYFSGHPDNGLRAELAPPQSETGRLRVVILPLLGTLTIAYWPILNPPMPSSTQHSSRLSFGRGE
jgi:hypothetical protein